MRDFHPGLSGGAQYQNEEQARRLWAVSARRAATSVQHKRHAAAEIYWRSAFDIALQHLQDAEQGLFTALHVLEPLQGLVNLFIEQGRWMAARSLATEVSDYLRRKNCILTAAAERTLNAIFHRIATAQRELSAAPVADNVEEIPIATTGRVARSLRSAGVT